jgi:L-lactate dehydrogenase complex protein LldG
LTGWGSSRDYPRPAALSFHQRFARLTTTPPNAQSPVAFTPLQPAGTPEAAISQPVDLIERFTAELVSLGGQVRTCSEQELATKILEFLHHERVRRIQAWEADRLPPRLLDTLVEGGIEITHDAEPDIQVGLTGALAGIADTGTLALAAGPGQPQCTSLLPEIHLAVLRGEQVYENLAQLFSSQGEVFQKTSVVLVTGPSRTADIEMTLTIGVHGPRQVHVFCI